MGMSVTVCVCGQYFKRAVTLVSVGVSHACIYVLYVSTVPLSTVWTPIDYFNNFNNHQHMQNVTLVFYSIVNLYLPCDLYQSVLTL